MEEGKKAKAKPKPKLDARMIEKRERIDMRERERIAHKGKHPRIAVSPSRSSLCCHDAPAKLDERLEGKKESGESDLVRM